jgi:outer membrane protein assembly factor BamB
VVVKPAIRRFPLVVAAVAVITMCVSWTVAAADWPQWRGPSRTGLSLETGLLKQWPTAGPRLVWQRKGVGDGFSTPAVVGDRIFLLGNEGLQNEYVRALDVADGKLVWSTRIGKVGNPDQQPAYPGARSTPTVDAGILYALGSDGDLVALGAHNGNVVWKKNLRTEFGGVPGIWAYAESPLVDGETLIVTPGGKTSLVALNKKTGAVIWRSVVPGAEPAGYASIAIARTGGIKQYVTFLEKGLVGIDAATGGMLWRDNRTAEGSAANIPTPVVGDGFVYHATSQIGGALVRLSLSQGKVVAQPAYAEKRLPGANGGTILIDGHFYGTNSQSLMCIEAATGVVKWQERGIGTASLAVADGLLYLHGENGDVALVEASPAGYRERGRFTPPAQPERGGRGNPMGASKAWSHPVVANGRLYIRDLDSLWSYDVSAASVSSTARK